MPGFIRKALLVLAFAAFGAAWAGVIVTYFIADSTAAFVVAVTFAALATEALFWTLAIIGGWAVFANRKKLWNRFFGQTSR